MDVDSETGNNYGFIQIKFPKVPLLLKASIDDYLLTAVILEYC